MEKYKELYELSIKLLFEEQNRFNRIDQKASWYLSALVLLIGIAGYFVTWVIEKFVPPQNIVEWSLFVLALLLAVLIVINWFICFSVHKVHEVVKIPLTTEMIKFFDTNEIIDIYYTLARGNKIAYERNVKTTNLKAKKLALVYKMMMCAVAILVLFSIIFGAYKWSEKMETIKQADSSSANISSQGNSPSPQNDQNLLPSAQNSNAQVTQKPNPNIKPPSYQVLTESYDPSKIRRDTIVVKDDIAEYGKKE